MSRYESRQYQSRALDEVFARFAAGKKHVCLVAPPGAGKLVMSVMAIERMGARALFVAPRREIVLKAYLDLRAHVGRVGLVMGDEHADPGARIQVASMQTLLRRPPLDGVEFVVADECHHDQATEWRGALRAYSDRQWLGLTATPARGDGQPLGDLFEEMVVAAGYQELIASGHLAECRLVQPDNDLGSDLALDPVEAWAQHSEGSSTIVFAPRVAAAKRFAEEFGRYGISARVISADTKRSRRDQSIALFERGIVQVLVNVATLTEGIHLPESRTVILARNFAHVSAYLQATGRCLHRNPEAPAQDAIVIDLVGSSHRHGSPVADREYSLSGRAISGPPIDRQPHDRDSFEQKLVPTHLRIALRGALAPGEQPRRVDLGEPIARRKRAPAGPMTSAKDSEAFDVQEGYAR